MPAAPFIEVEVNGLSVDGQTRHVWALADSGSDATMLPLRILNAVGATYKETRWMRGVAHGRVEVDLYLVSLNVGDMEIPGLHVIATHEANEAILGRDALNQMVVTLNGLANVTQIHVP